MANRVTEILGIEKPIIQGPLAWLTNGRYAAAVSAAGGLGVLGISAGQKVAATTVEETIENMRREIHIVREITDKPLGINVAPGSELTDRFTGPMLELMVEEQVPVAVMVGEFSAYWAAKFKEKGIKIVSERKLQHHKIQRKLSRVGLMSL